MNATWHEKIPGQAHRIIKILLNLVALFLFFFVTSFGQLD